METVAEISSYELERGKPVPSKLHAYTQSRLSFLLQRDFINQYDVLTEINIALPHKDRTATPDIAVFPKLDIDFLHDEVTMSQPPLCAIEILSMSQGVQEMVLKAEDYFTIGVRSCWIVIPNLQTIYVFSSPRDYRVFAQTDTLEDPSLNVTLPLTAIFGRS